MNVFETKNLDELGQPELPFGLGLAVVLTLVALFLGGIINGAAALAL